MRRLDVRRFEAQNWLLHFVGGEYTAFCETMSNLYDGGYVGRVKEHLHHDTVHARHLVHFLTDKGRRVLEEHDVKPVFKTTKQYLHECLTAFVYDGLEYGAGEQGFKFIGWDKLQHDKRVHARHQENPFAIKLPSGKYLRIDGSPIIFGHPDPRRDDICIPGCEIDRNTEPLRSFDLREKWQDKIDAIREFVKMRVYASHYGFENCLIPIVTTNPTHMLNIMQLVKEKIGSPEYLIFKAVPDWPKERRFPVPNGSMFNDPWRRVGHSDLVIGA